MALSPRRDKRSRPAARNSSASSRRSEQSSGRSGSSQSARKSAPPAVAAPGSSHGFKVTTVADPNNLVDSNVLQAVKANKEAKRTPSNVRSRNERNARPARGERGARPSGRNERGSRFDDQDSRRAPARKAKGNDSMPFIIGGVAALLLIVIIAVAMGGDSKKATRKIETNSGPVSAASLAAQAEAARIAGKREEAAHLFMRAAEAAQAAGDENAAVRYNQKGHGLGYKTAY